MKKLFFSLSITFVILVITNISWIGVNIYMFVVHGIESIVSGETLIENIYYSMYIKWILFADLIWIFAWFAYILQRKVTKLTQICITCNTKLSKTQKFVL